MGNDFLDRVDYGEHWRFRGAKTSAQYGSVRHGGKVVSTHRLAFELFKGEIPEGMCVDHKCSVRECIRPSHLRLLTRSENSARQLPRTPATHCRAGHPFEGHNVVHRAGGSRCCRRCKNDRNRRWMARYRQRRRADGIAAPPGRSPR